jgi:RNA polymerase-associated protein LEO1
MSSLAGALDQPTNYNHGFDTELPPVNQEGFADEDVDMNPPSTDIPPKEEDDAMTISAPLEDKVQDDEEMEDLFGNEIDDVKADAKSDR